LQRVIEKKIGALAASSALGALGGGLGARKNTKERLWKRDKNNQ